MRPDRRRHLLQLGLGAVKVVKVGDSVCAFVRDYLGSRGRSEATTVDHIFIQVAKQVTDYFINDLVGDVLFQFVLLWYTIPSLV